MVSKNNYQQLIKNCFNQRQHWGLRKLSIGVASVLLGTAIIAQGSVYADTQSVPADSAENGISSTGESAASGHTYVLKSSQDTSATTDSQAASTSTAPVTIATSEEQTDHDVNGVQTTFTRSQSAVTGNSDSNPISNESGAYWPDTKGASIKNYDKTITTDFSTDKAAAENQVIDPSTIKGYDQEYSDTPNLMHTQDLHLYVNGKEVDVNTLPDDDSLNGKSEYPNHISKGHAHLIKVSDFGPNTYFYARNAVQKYNQITGAIEHYDVKWTLESVNYANEQALLAFGIKGILDSGGNLLFNVGSGWQVAKRGNFANTHLQFFKEVNIDNFVNQDGTLKETVAEAIKNGDIVATALKIHEGFLDLDSDEAIEITESAVKNVLVDDSSTLAYQKTSDGYLAITRTYNDTSNHDPKFGNSDSVAVLLELDVPEEGFDLSIVTIGPSSKGEISGGSKVAPAVLNTAAYLKTLTVNYYELDENGNPTAIKLKDTKTAHNFIGKSYGLQNTDQDQDGKQDAFDYSAPQEITDQDGTTWKLVKQTGNNLKDNTYQDCLNVINYYYQKSEVHQQGTESVTYKFYNDQEKTKLVKEITKTPVYQDGKWQWQVKETDYDDQGKETHQTTTTDSLMEGLSADQATVEFTGTVNYDGNGKVTGTTWDANNKTYGTIKTPAVEGYTADKDNVGGETVLPNDSSLNRAYEVVYTQNRYRLTEKFVDEAGNELLSSVPKGSSYKNGDGFDVTKDAKVIPGYVLVKRDNTSGKFGNGDQTATFIYKKVGKLIPVDENNQAIPGADTPTYKNDQTDPTKALNPTVPSIDGWKPKNNQPGDSITPKDPTQDTPVPYVQVVSGTIKYIDDTTGKQLSSEPLKKGTVGSKISYTTKDKIESYEDQGYELVSNNFSDGTQTYAKEGNDFEVHLKHATKETVSYKDATQTIHYTGAGSDTPADKVQTEKNAFSKTDTIDKVTGEVIKTTGWTGTKTFGTEDTPVVNGYHADKKDAGGLTATVDNPNVKETVTYAPNGKLIPVDPNGTPIPGANTPTYTTNPNDPTKVLNPTVPSIDGWKPKNNQPGDSITPKDPTQDTPVPYVQVVSGKIKYIDDTTGKELSSESLKKGTVGSKIDYTTKDKIESYEDQGYELVSNNFSDGTQTYAKEGNDFEVHLKHATKSVTPDDPATPGQPINPKGDVNYPDGVAKNDLTATVKRTINYVDEDGNKVNGAPDGTSSYVQTAEFTRTAIVDRVTGKILGYDTNNDGKVDTESADRAWMPINKTLEAVKSADPSSVGYDKVDIANVSSLVVTPDQGDKTVTVTYSNNPVSGKIKYVDDTTGKELSSENLKKGAVGSKIDYTTKDKIESYEDQGYELVSNDFTDGSQVYKKTGNDFVVHLKHKTQTITPNDPNPVTPGQPINPNNPNSPVYPTEVDHKNLAKDASQTIHYIGAGDKTPADNIVRQKDAFTRTITIDKVTGKILSITPWSTKTFNTVNTPVVNGYHADKKAAGGLTATVDKPNVKDTVTYAPNGKLIPVDPNGTPIPGANTPTYTTNPNDPTKVLNPTVPSIDGWKPKDKRPGDSVVPTNPGKDTPVVYVKKRQKPVMPVIPEQPKNSALPNNSEQPRTPNQSDNSKQPTIPTAPDQPNDSIVPNDSKHLATSTPRDQSISTVPGKSTQQATVSNSVTAERSAAADSEKESTLPQTGNDNSQAKAAMGLGLTSLSTIMAMFGLKKRRHN